MRLYRGWFWLRRSSCPSPRERKAISRVMSGFSSMVLRKASKALSVERGVSAGLARRRPRRTHRPPLQIATCLSSIMAAFCWLDGGVIHLRVERAVRSCLIASFSSLFLASGQLRGLWPARRNSSFLVPSSCRDRLRGGAPGAAAEAPAHLLQAGNRPSAACLKPGTPFGVAFTGLSTRTVIELAAERQTVVSVMALLSVFPLTVRK